MKLKKMLSSFVVISMLLSTISFTAFAEEQTNVDSSLIFNLDFSGYKLDTLCDGDMGLKSTVMYTDGTKAFELHTSKNTQMSVDNVGGVQALKLGAYGGFFAKEIKDMGLNGNSVTLESWIYKESWNVDAATQAYQPLLALATNANSKATGVTFNGGNVSSHQKSFMARVNNEDAQTFCYDDYFKSDEWQHVVLTSTYADNTTTLTIYVDGVKKDTFTKSGVKVDVNKIYIGDYSRSDDLKVAYATLKAYNKALSENEIKAIFNAEKAAYSGATAAIGDRKFATLQSALEAANSEDTIVILSDIVLEETLTISADKNIIIDLNGKSISQEKECSSHYGMIENYGTLVIDDNSAEKTGTISFTDTGAGDANFGWGSYTIINRGILTVNEGTILNDSKQNPGNGQPNVHMYCAIQQSAGETTINGGTISTPTYRSVRVNKGNLTITDGNFIGQVWLQPNQGNATISVSGGTFTNAGNDGSSIFLTNVGENYTVSEASITDGTFNGKIGCSDATDEVLAGCVSGGTFTANAASGTNDTLIANDYELKENADGTFGVVLLPVAEVKNLGAVTITDYDVYNGSLVEGTDPIDLQIAMEFIAKDTPEQAQENAFADYTTDFFIEISGLSSDNFIANGCYLAGHYGDFGWIQIPLDGMTIENGKVYPVITSVGFNFSYVDICTLVKDFKCGIYLSQEVLNDNPELKVTLTLGLSKDMDAALAGNFMMVDDVTYVKEDFENNECIWVTDFDSGFYYDGETKLGMMRFLFAAEQNGIIEEYGIKYSNGDDITDEITTNNKTVSNNGNVNAFYGDLNGIEENADTRYYAIAFIKVNGKYLWSDIVSCIPNWSNNYSGYIGGNE